MRSLAIETPEGVVFSYELATPAARALAWAVDFAAIATAGYLLGKVSEMFGAVSRDWASAFSLALYFFLSLAYGIVLEWRWRGQTIGKRLLGLRVVDAQGLRLQFSQIAIRNLVRLVDMLPMPYLVGGIAALTTRKCQRLGDLAANTVVARESRQQQPDLELIAPARYNSLSAYPHLVARLRAAANAEAVGMAARAAAQREGYEPRARVRLFADLAHYFRELAAFPEEAVEGLTDEQYVRSVLRVLYRQAPTSGRPTG
jgi:uncharacterized RDD family membrane protein YckC